MAGRAIGQMVWPLGQHPHGTHGEAGNGRMTLLTPSLSMRLAECAAPRRPMAETAGSTMRPRNTPSDWAAMIRDPPPLWVEKPKPRCLRSELLVFHLP
jgi:hypothetical protein